MVPAPSLTLDEEFARIAREEIVGFAGHYLDADGSSVIMLADEAGRAAAVRYATALRARARVPVRRPIVRLVKYDFNALKTWHDALLPLFGANGFVMLDIDETSDKLVVGLDSLGSAAQLRKEVQRLGIPAAAVQFKVVARPVVRSTLRDRASQMQGGYQIYGFGNGICSLGFNAMWGTKKIFVTASHCSDANFQLDGSPLYQPLAAYAPNGSLINDIATEVRDRGFSGGFRSSDAAYFEYTSSVSAGFDYLMAFTNAEASGQPSTVDVDPSSPTQVVGRFADSYAYVGYTMYKTGRGSGRTYGAVTQTCVTISVSPGINFSCQWVGNVYGDRGDSGSPVYAQYYFGWYAEIHGILWGGPPGDPTVSWWSPLSGIERDLGSIRVCGTSQC